MSSNPLPSPQSPLPSRHREVLVWDLPIRVFHWSLLVLVCTAVISGKMGGNAMEIHLLTGYGILVLVVFRLLWGIVGSPCARFASFVHGLPTVLVYCRSMVRGQAYAHRSHNPLGGWAVVLMLTALAVQAGTGLFANDDIDCEGPLASRYGKDFSDLLTALHKLNFKVLAALIGLHVTAIVFYLAIKRINLIRPMITGRAQSAPEHPHPERPIPAYTNLFAFVLLVLVAAGLYWLMPRA